MQRVTRQQAERIREGELHVILAARRGGLVAILYTKSPLGWCEKHGEELQLEAVEIRASAAAERVVCHLRSLFRQVMDTESAMPWYEAKLEHVRDQLEALNLRTGAPLEHFALNSPVYVLPQYARGNVIGFQGDRVMVRLDSAPNISNLVLAMRDRLIPVQRLAALVAPKT